MITMCDNDCDSKNIKTRKILLELEKIKKDEIFNKMLAETDATRQLQSYKDIAKEMKIHREALDKLENKNSQLMEVVRDNEKNRIKALRRDIISCRIKAIGQTAEKIRELINEINSQEY
jgi:hypothetical protein